MVQRSAAMSFALVASPNLCLVAIRLGIPTFSEALSNDLIAELGLHIFALLIGVAMVSGYRFVEDHEYHRSKAIDGLSKTYRHEDKALWEEGDVAIQRLEAKAFADFKGKRAVLAREKMKSNIGVLNKEAKEVEAPQHEDGGYSIRIDGIEQSLEPPSEIADSKPPLARISEFWGRTVDRAASKRVATSSSKENTTQPAAAILSKTKPDFNPQWDVPEEVLEQKPPVNCNDCGSFNNPGINYCTSCGSYISLAGNG
ncbi:MAG: hypothetical protein CMA54_00910 [Euryarchaeota archaeon]|nr:hypothetical protein [Euryarchaeota archaeon]